MTRSLQGSLVKGEEAEAGLLAANQFPVGMSELAPAVVVARLPPTEQVFCAATVCGRGFGDAIQTRQGRPKSLEPGGAAKTGRRIYGGVWTGFCVATRA